MEGYRCVYYTRKGQEWRVAAWRLMWAAVEKYPLRWNYGFERLSSMLFGYEEWQTDFWIPHLQHRRGAWGGRLIYCAVTADEFAWIQATGYRAFPSTTGLPLTFTLSNDRPTGEAIVHLLGSEAISLVRASISGDMVRDISREQTGPNYVVPAVDLPKLNNSIVGTIEVIAHRNGVGP